MRFLGMSISEISQGVREQKFTAEEVVSESIDRISGHDKKLNSFVSTNERAIEDAKKVDKKVQSGGDAGPLAGVPISFKDMFCTKGIETTACSKILSGFVPPYSSTIVERALSNGAVLVGKNNCDEFAMGSSNENSAFGVAKNPWSPEYVTGGSSGGSAAAVSARLVSGSFGTDTGGSIRQPASFCGVVGLKPTYSLMSRYGIVAFASSLDQAGPFANSVLDCAILSEAVAGFDPKDSTSNSVEIPKWSQNIQREVKGLRIGLPKGFLDESLSSDVLAAIQDTIANLKKEGADFVEIDLPHTEFAVPTYYLICTSEASSNLSRYDGVRYGKRTMDSKDLFSMYSETRGQGFGIEVKRRMLWGTFALSSGYYDDYYIKACRLRRLIQNDYIKAFKACDVILSPIATTPAFKIGEKTEDVLSMYLNDIFTISTNLAGLPGMSVPVGLSQSGLPLSVQLTAPHFKEQTLFNVGAVVEDISPWGHGVPDGF